MLYAFAKSHPRATSVGGDVACVNGTTKVSEECATSTRRALETLTHLTTDKTALHAATIVSQAADMFSQGNVAAIRDAAMAENLAWAAHTLYPNARFALWAHDGHIMTQPFFRGVTSMGAHLQQTFGHDYYAVGFAFYGGSVSPTGAVAPVPLATAGPQTADALWHAVAEPMFFIDLHSPQAGSQLGDYLVAPQQMRMIGSFSNPSDLAYVSDTSLSLVKSFDTLIFVDETHGAHTFSNAVDSVSEARETTIPANAAGWSLGGKWSVLGSRVSRYDIGVDPTVTREGAESLRLRSLATADPTTWAAATNSVDVTEYRGHRIRLTGFLSSKNVTSYATAWVRVDAPDTSASAFDNMSDRQLHGSTPWKPFSIEVAVAPKSRYITIGVALGGTGTVWADNLRVELVP